MESIILSVLFSYRNSVLANKKGQNAVIWVLITIAALFMAMFAGMMVVLALFYRGPITPQDFQKFLLGNPLRSLTIYAISAGGGLLVGYILDRMPDKKKDN